MAVMNIKKSTFNWILKNLNCASSYGYNEFMTACGKYHGLKNHCFFYEHFVTLEVEHAWLAVLLTPVKSYLMGF